MEGNKEAQKETRINVGLYNYWYPVVASWNVKNAPVGITRLSQNIVLWCDTVGQVHVPEDRCPHRGVRLSMGWNLGDHVACWYHGVEVNGQDTVTSVPAVDACPMEGRTCVCSYPVQERVGVTFLWFGDKAPSEFDDAVGTLRLFEELVSDEYNHFLCFVYWNVNYRYAIDNVIDPMHGAYLRVVLHSMASGEKKAMMEVVETDHGAMFQKTGRRDVNSNRTKSDETGMVWLRLLIPHQPKVGPGGPFTIIGIVTPVDEEHCIVYFWRTRHVQGWQRDVRCFLYRDRLEGLYWNVLEQDRVVLESMAPEARDRETLYQHDIGIMRIRRVPARHAITELADVLVTMIKSAPTEAQHA